MDGSSLIELLEQQSICRGVSHAIHLLILCVAYCVYVCVYVLFKVQFIYVFGGWGSLL